MRSIPGKIIWMIVMVFTLIQFYGITINTDESLEKRELFAEMCEFADGVVDSRVITESELREFNTLIASHGFSVDYEIRRLVRSVDPDPLNENDYVPTWIEVDDIMHYNQGDKLVLHVWSTGSSTSRNVLNKLNLFGTDSFDETVPVRIR